MAGSGEGNTPTPVNPEADSDDPQGGKSPSRGSRFVSWLRQFAKLWGFALFCIFVVYLFRDVALPFIFALLVAYILAPAVDWMSTRWRIGAWRLPRWLAVILLYINILAGLGLFVGYFIPKLSGDFARLFHEAPQLFAKVNEEWVPRIGAYVDRHLGSGLPQSEDAGSAAGAPAKPARELTVEQLPDGRYRVDLSQLNLEVQGGEDGKYVIAPPAPPDDSETRADGRWERSIKRWIAERVKSTEGASMRAFTYGQKFVKGVVSGIAKMVLVLMVAAFILVDLTRVRTFMRSLVPVHYASDYDRIVVGIDRGLSGVIRGQLLICIINGVLTYIGLMIFHVKYPLLLGGIAAIMSLVPIFGSILSSVPIVAVALVSSGTFDLRQGVFVLLWIIGIHLVESNFLNPKIMGNASKIHPVLVVFALIAGEHSYGLVGALFAVPVASIIQTIFTYYRHPNGTMTPAAVPSHEPEGKA